MRVVIIGNGAAGNQAAETIRKHNDKTELIMLSHETFPEYSACALPDCMAGWIPRSNLFLKNESDYEKQRIKTLFGRQVSYIDVQNKELSIEDKLIAYDKLILASGSRPIIPPLNGSNLEGNFVLKSVADLDRILEYRSSRVVVVGSGNIGVEVAEALEIQGSQVVLIELLERLMPRIFSNKAAAILRDSLEKHHIKVLTGEKVLEVTGAKRVEGIITDKREIPCDTIIWAVGVRQNVELALQAGIETGRLGGIKVNRHMQTNIKDVYACGDCIESFDILSGKPSLSLLWPSAKRQAEVAALNCLGREIEYEGSLNVVIEEFYDTSFVAIGLTADALKEYEVQLIEKEDSRGYYCLAVLDDRVIGLELIGDCDRVGVIMSLIKNRTAIPEVKRIISNPELLANIPWYADAGEILFPDRNI